MREINDPSETDSVFFKMFLIMSVFGFCLLICLDKFQNLLFKYFNPLPLSVLHSSYLPMKSILSLSYCNPADMYAQLTQ